jgi:hypothetical protein
MIGADLRPRAVNLNRMSFMRTVVLAILTLGLISSLGSAANAADLSRDRSYGKRAHVSRAAADWPRLRVVEQVPYCGDCDNLIGRPSGPYVRLHYIGYLPWTRGCALGGCYGAYNDYGCYWREVPVADGRGGWVRSVERFCNGVLLSER